jgi:hypothetical protein
MEVLKDLLGQPRSRVEFVKALTAPITAKWHYPGGNLSAGLESKRQPESSGLDMAVHALRQALADEAQLVERARRKDRAAFWLIIAAERRLYWMHHSKRRRSAAGS